jgi:hypothetical protein
MSDISQPAAATLVQRRLDGGSQGTGRDPSAPPAKKVVETYKETDRAKPVDDRITILGIPAEQITPATHAALASLVAEINFLRGLVQRHERSARPGAVPAPKPDAALDSLAAALTAPVHPDDSRVMVLAYLNTFDDVRRSSGLLAAKTLLADVFTRFEAVQIAPTRPIEGQPQQGRVINPEPAVLLSPTLVGGAGMAGIFNLPSISVDDTAIAHQVRDTILTEGFLVSGIEMSVSLAVGAAVASRGEGLLTLLGRVDHMIRGAGY